jgi:hypothetical protein
MIIHCSRKLAAKLPVVSSTPLDETSPLGSWHAHLYYIDRRQCVMLCHEASRFVLFLPGFRKQEFAELGDKLFRQFFRAALVALECPEVIIKQVELALGPIRFDTATNRSVQGSMRIAMQDLETRIYEVPNVMNLDPVAASCRLNERPTTIFKEWLWPNRVMLDAVRTLAGAA